MENLLKVLFHQKQDFRFLVFFLENGAQSKGNQGKTEMQHNWLIAVVFSQLFENYFFYFYILNLYFERRIHEFKLSKY